MNYKIKRVTHKIHETSNRLHKCNVITVEFLHTEEKNWRIRVETATLKNYVEETGGSIVLNPIDSPHRITNCNPIELWFEDDEIMLIDEAEFSITVRRTIYDKMETYTFVLNDNEWKLKEDNDNVNNN